MKENSFKRNRKAMMALLLCTGFIVTQPISVMAEEIMICLLYTSPSPRDRTRSRMPSSA